MPSCFAIRAAVSGNSCISPSALALLRAVGKVAREAGVEDSGYRILANHGPDSHQEVPHLHIHVFGGRKLGGMLPRKD